MSEEMKKLVIDGTEFEVVDAAGRQRITVLENTAPSGGGLSITEKNLILQLFNKAAYAEDDAGTAYATLSNLWTGSYHSVAWEGTGYTHGNSDVAVEDGESFTSTITANNGKTIESVTVTMGGETVQGAYSGGTITIPNITGDIVITVTTAQMTVSSISAVYTQSGTVYDTDSLDSLKADLVVTATFPDSSTAVIPATDYTLSGTLLEGTSSITVSYGGKTASFNVTVTHAIPILYDWDFKTSLTDKKSGETAVLTGCTRDSSGVSFTEGNQAIKLTSQKISVADKTFIFDIDSYTGDDSTVWHARLFFSDSADTNTSAGAAGFVYRHGTGWTVYSGSAWGSAFNKTTYPIDFFSNKRLKIYISSDLKLTVSYADIGSDSFTTIGTIALAFASDYASGYWIIGGTLNNKLQPMTLSAVKVYEGEV